MTSALFKCCIIPRLQAQESGTHAPLKVMLGDSDTYVMESVKREDEGRYFCKVTNDLGSEEIYTDVVVVGMYFLCTLYVSVLRERDDHSFGAGANSNPTIHLVI